MRKLIILLFILCGSLFSQHVIWNENVSATNQTTYYSNQINLFREFPYDGLICFSADVDSTNILGTFGDGADPDSLLYFVEYRVGKAWVTGDTLLWYKVIDDQSWADSTTYVLPRTHHDWNMIAIINPNDGDNVVENIKEIPRMFIRIKRIDTAGTNYSHYMDIVKR